MACATPSGIVTEPVFYGLGGAPMAELAKLPQIGQPGDLVFFGVDAEIERHFGCANDGAAVFVRDNTIGMMPWTQACARPCTDIGIVTATQPDVILREATTIARYVSALGRRPALIGCDHTASIAGLTGTLQGSGRRLSYLFFDAHLDLGLHAPVDRLHNGNFAGRILQMDMVSRVVNVGGRSWATYAPIYREIPRFTSIAGGLPPIPAAAAIAQLERLGLKGEPLYVSIDADVLDPSCAPNVPCPEPFGMTAADLFMICRWIGESCTVVGADLCEILPSKQSLGSEQALMRCLHALFPK
jgi:arginase family enzyme